MSLITFLAPDMKFLEKARELLKAEHGDIHFEVGLLSEGVKIASSLVAKGTEIIISRAGTASAIRQAGIEVIVVEIPITGFDIIRAVEKAKKHGTTIGAVAFSPMIRGIELLNSSLGVEIRQYPLSSEYEAEAKVAQAFQDGAAVVIGGFISGKVAKKSGYPFVLIESGEEGIIQAVQEAKRIAYARNLEKTKASLFRAVLDYSYDGVISVDDSFGVTFFNPVAERITGINRSKVIGKKITSVWPELNIEKVISSSKDDLGQILNINKTDVLCNKVSIVVNKKSAGAVITFQDVTQIQQMEARVRRRIYASGHVAGYSFSDIITNSSALERTKEIAKDYSLTDSSILIAGESGTGKELFAQSCHNFSKRRQGAFVAINCAALPGQILESELFGYVGGAFTGANQKGKLGLFEVAHGGTIFLDEIAEIDHATQGKLLRVLQEKKVMRLGSDKIIPVDVRVIAATNKNLKSLVDQNQFRSDLYYRLNVLQLKIPPLRNRKEDIKPLAQFFLDQNAGIAKRHLKLSSSAVQALKLYDWPGNVRELQNIIERVIVSCKQEMIDASIINQVLEDQQDQNPLGAILPNELLEIKQALATSKGKYAEAAKILGISRSTLWRKLKVLGIQK